MPRRRYRLQRGEPRRLLLQWRRGFRDLSVTLDGVTTPIEDGLVDRIVHLALPDGSTLWVQRVPARWWTIELCDRLRLERHGAPVPGSDFDPRAIGRRAAVLMALFGLLSFASAVLWVVMAREARTNPLEGLLLMLLAAFAAFGRRFPVIAGASLVVLSAVLPMLNGVWIRPEGLLLRAALAAHLYGRWQTMRPAPGTKRVRFG